METQHISVHWYRHGLRIHDNPALHQALKGAKEFYPIFIFDGQSAGTRTAKLPRMRFLLESLADLDESYKKLGNRLYCFNGDAVEVFRDLIDEWNVTRVTFEQDPEPIWLERDNAVKELFDRKNIEWIECVSHTLWDPQKVFKANSGQPPHTYQLFKSVTDMLGLPEEPLPPPEFSHVSMLVPEKFDGRYAIPTLKQLGVTPECEEQLNPFNRWYGGETEALRLYSERISFEEKAIKNSMYLVSKIKPDLVGRSRSLSPHLRFGTLSIRKFYAGLRAIFKKAHDLPDTNLIAQLIWREYFYCMSYQNINYGQMKDNPICLQINWRNDEERMSRWKNAKTGFPWIDAIMVQLQQEGWIHHVARHAVACFVTRGDLWCAWDEGFKVMEPYLLDGDWSVCAGNWMWVSSSAFENCLQCPNCFSPVTFGMQIEPTGVFIKRYLPVLKDMPLKYLYSPWKAPLDVQKKANCIIGEDYPMPIVDHMRASRENKLKMESIKRKINDPNIWHCAPANVEELQQFCCLPKSRTSMLSRCTSNENCVGMSF